MKRKAFLDWSGNLGFKYAGGSSRFLVFALVICADYTHLHEATRQFKRQRHLPDDFELHYTRMPHKLRRTFFAWLAMQMPSLHVAVLTIDKTRLSRTLRWMNAVDFISYFVEQTVALVSHELEGAQLLVDGERDLIKLRRRIGKTLSAEGYELDDVQLRDSRLEVGLQLADMLAGAVMDVLEGKPILFDLIQAGVTLKSFAAENSE